MIYSRRFFISWILSSILMYVAFYLWHGIFLNDLKRISFSKPLFLSLAALVYLVISFILYKTFESKLFQHHFLNPVFRGLISGVLIGFILFAIVTVLGISFAKDINMTYLAVDCGWQVIEQLIGGFIIGFMKLVIFEPLTDMEPLKKSTNLNP